MITRKSRSWKAHILATADDYCTTNIIGKSLGLTPHTTGMMSITPEAGNDFKIYDNQLSYYNFSIQESSPFYYTCNTRFRNSKYTELAISAKRSIKKGECFFLMKVYIYNILANDF